MRTIACAMTVVFLAGLGPSLAPSEPEWESASMALLSKAGKTDDAVGRGPTAVLDRQEEPNVWDAILETIEQIGQPPRSSNQSREVPQRQSQALSDKLSVFAPLIGPVWVGTIPGDLRMGEIVLKWEVLLNGHAVRLRRTAINFDHSLETTYHWDEAAGRIAFLALSNTGVSIKGFASVEGDALICEGVQQGPEVGRLTRRIYQLGKDGKLLEDDLFRSSDSESWRRTHVSVFVAK